MAKIDLKQRFSIKSRFSWRSAPPRMLRPNHSGRGRSRGRGCGRGRGHGHETKISCRLVTFVTKGGGRGQAELPITKRASIYDFELSTAMKKQILS